MSKYLVGIIAEDDSDVDCMKHFLRRMRPDKSLGFKKFVGQGCGKISRKANAWANIFKVQGCKAIIVLHDRDRNEIGALHAKISQALLPSPVSKCFICIPVEEMEAWLLSDDAAFRSVFSIQKKITLPSFPELVPSPKEFIRKIVRAKTDKKVDYINTKHNERLAEHSDISKISDKCPSFLSLVQFVAGI